MRSLSLSRLAWIAALAGAGAFAQSDATGSVQTESFTSEALRDNVIGESATRRISIYLPPSYASSPERRYPVLFLLHGIQDSDQTWTQAWASMADRAPYNTIQDLLNLGVREGRFGEMIVVMPDAGTRLGGSFYVNSETTGNWEDFIAGELVRFIDDRYRTLARPQSRGVAGHSMGGYGAISFGLRRPDVFGAVYAMNPAALGLGGDLTKENPAFEAVLAAKSFDDLLRVGPAAFAVVALAQAFSPNRNRPPFFIDLPYTKGADGLVEEPGVYEKWLSRFPVNMIAERMSSFERMAGFRFDTAWEDEYTHIPITSRAFARALEQAGVAFRFDEYNGDHRNRLWGRQGRLYTDVLPFFWRTLQTAP